ncbi:tetratricopeptide repeat protein [soil metagenome]
MAFVLAHVTTYLPMQISTAARSSNARWWLLAVLALTLAVHGRDITAEFLNWADGALVLENKFLSPVNAEHLRQMWTQPIKDLYTPLAYSAWAAAAAVGRLQTPDEHGVVLNPMIFHALNLLLHLACVAIVFDVLLLLPPRPEGERAGLCEETLTEKKRSTKQATFDASSETKPRSEPERFASHLTSPRRGEGQYVVAAAIGAAVFAVHPVQVEAVAWISGMNNLLAGVFALACVAFYIRFARAERPMRAGWYVAVCVSMLLALFSKPTAIITPLLILPIDALLLRRSWRAIAWSLTPLVLMAIPFVIIGRLSQLAPSTYVPPVLQRLIVAGDALGFHLRKLVWPNPLLIDYGRQPQRVLAAGGFSAINWITLAAAVTLAVITWRRQRWVAACLAIFVGGVALVLGLVPFSFQEYSTVADRYVYLSMLGVAIAVAMLLTAFRSAASKYIAAAVVLAFAACSFHQAGYWADSTPLAQHTLAYEPDSLAATSMLAFMAQHDGDHVTEEYYYRKGLNRAPNDVELNYNLGTLLLADRPAEALKYFDVLYNRGIRDPRLLNNRGMALMNIGRLPEAIDTLNEALRVSPTHATAYLNLGQAMLTLNRLDEAEKNFRRALELEQRLKKARDGLANVQAARGGH